VEQLYIDMYGAQLLDLFNTYLALEAGNSTDELYNQVWPTNLEYFEKQLAKNGNGYLVGSEMSWADLYLCQMTDFLFDKKDQILSKFPNVKQLDLNIRSLPRIADWIKRRPVSDSWIN
jgi:glutathione S-transferase